MEGKKVRIGAFLLGVLLIAGYWFLPNREERRIPTGGGHQKWTLEKGDNVSWNWTPVVEDCRALDIYLKGIKKGPDMILTMSLTNESGKEVARTVQAISNLGKDDKICLYGSFHKGTLYTLSISAEGEGSIGIKGSEDEQGRFQPALIETGFMSYRNPVLVFFAFGWVMLAMVPVNGAKGVVSKCNQSKELVARLLPWGTFLLIFLVGLLVDLRKPVFKPDQDWVTWDEEIHLSYVQDLALISNNGLRGCLNSVVTWHPAYLPLSVGYNVGELLGLAGWNNPELPYRCAVVFSTFCYAGMCALAVKRSPRYKVSFLLAGSCPLLIFQATSMTYDTVVAASLILGVALVLETLEQERRMSTSRAMTLTALLAFGTVAKPAYSVAFLSLFLIPKEKFANKREKILFRFFVLGMILWCAAGMLMPGPYQDVLKGDPRIDGTDSAAQIRSILGDPLGRGLLPFEYLLDNWYALMVYGIDYWGYIGRGLTGFMEMYLVLMLMVAPLCICGEDECRKSSLTLGRRLTLGLIAFLAELVLTYAQYIATTPVGGFIVGMQSRYFLPLWILVLLALMWPQRVRSKASAAGNVMTLAVFIIICIANVENALIHLREFSLV